MVSEHGGMMVWNVHWIGGRWAISDYLAKIHLALAKLAGEGDNSATVMVYTPHREDERDVAAATLERFLAEMGNGLAAMLEQTAIRCPALDRSR